MKTKLFFIFLTAALFTGNINGIDIDGLIKSMSIEDKCGQMTQVDVGLVRKDEMENDEDFIDMDKLKQALIGYKIGSILGVPSLKAKVWHKVLKAIQDVATQNTVHKIPILYGTDSIHGAFVENTILFPQPISWASTFNKDLVEKIGEVIAKETRALGIPWNFSPVLDIGRMPVWPR